MTMKQKPRQQRSAERRSKERINAWSSPCVGGESIPCSTNVRNDATGCTYIQVQESYAKIRGVQVRLEIPPEPLICLIQEAVEKLVDTKNKVEKQLEYMEARVDKLAYIASKLADRLGEKGEAVRYADFGVEDDDFQVELEYEFVDLADRLLHTEEPQELALPR
jgi:hypothetical protein